jgi:hypothetical protein
MNCSDQINERFAWHMNGKASRLKVDVNLNGIVQGTQVKYITILDFLRSGKHHLQMNLRKDKKCASQGFDVCAKCYSRFSRREVMNSLLDASWDPFTPAKT